MVYVCLLRGINVGGNAKVEMSRLKAAFILLGFEKVSTYINSGNVVFTDDRHDSGQLVEKIEAAIEKDFGLTVGVVVRDLPTMQAAVKALPSSWKNDATMKCDVLFLWEDVDKPDVVKQLSVKPEIEDLKYVPGAMLWRIDRANVTRGGLVKIIGTPLYKKMTIRNCNTVRKLTSMMEALA